MDRSGALTNSTSSDESRSPRKLVSFDATTPSQPTQNSRTTSQSPPKNIPIKNRVFTRSADTPAVPTIKPRSKTEPEIGPIFLQKSVDPQKKSLSKAPSPMEDERHSRSRDKQSSTHKIFSSLSPSPKKDPSSEENSDMIGFMKTCKRLQDHSKNPNTWDHKAGLPLFHKAVLSHCELLVDLFLQHPGLNSLTKNKDGRLPLEYFLPDDITKHNILYEKLRLRATLDHIIYALLVTNKNFFRPNPLTHTNQYITELLLRIPKEIIPAYSSEAFLLKMIQSRLKYYRSELTTIHNQYKNDLNHQDNFGDTILHLFVLLCDTKMVETLVKNPRITSLKRNNANLLPQSMLKSTENNVHDIHAMVFMRHSIENWIINAITKEDINNSDYLKNIYDNVKAQCAKVKKDQSVNDDPDNKDRELPAANADLPSYLTDTFILEYISTHMKDNMLGIIYQWLVNLPNYITLQEEFLFKPLNPDISATSPIVEKIKLQFKNDPTFTHIPDALLTNLILRQKTK